MGSLPRSHARWGYLRDFHALAKSEQHMEDHRCGISYASNLPLAATLYSTASCCCSPFGSVLASARMMKLASSARPQGCFAKDSCNGTAASIGSPIPGHFRLALTAHPCVALLGQELRCKNQSTSQFLIDDFSVLALHRHSHAAETPYHNSDPQTSNSRPPTPSMLIADELDSCLSPGFAEVDWNSEFVSVESRADHSSTACRKILHVGDDLRAE